MSNKKFIKDAGKKIEKDNIKILEAILNKKDKQLKDKIKLEEIKLNNLSAILSIREKSLADRVYVFYNKGQETYDELLYLQKLQEIFIKDERYEDAQHIQKQIDNLINKNK